MKNNLVWILSGLVVLLLIAIIVGAYFYGKKEAAVLPPQEIFEIQNQLKAIQEESAKKSLEEAAKAANPFKVENPLEGVKTNPFEDVRKKLNPFE